MFFRDDISSWLFKRMGGGSAIKSHHLRGFVASNTDACLARIRMVRSTFMLLATSSVRSPA